MPSLSSNCCHENYSSYVTFSRSTLDWVFRQFTTFTFFPPMMSLPLSTVTSFNGLVKKKGILSNCAQRRNCQKLDLEQSWERAGEAKWIHTLLRSKLLQYLPHPVMQMMVCTGKSEKLMGILVFRMHLKLMMLMMFVCREHMKLMLENAFTLPRHSDRNASLADSIGNLFSSFLVV